MNISKTIDSLRSNNFIPFFAKSIDEARIIFNNEILTDLQISSVSYGDSMTLYSTGLLESLKNRSDVTFIDTCCETDEWREKIRKRKQALTVDLFLMGCNAITENGQLVNLDMIGNRVAPLAFGPRHVVVFVGVNKIVSDVEAAFKRIKNVAAPLNAIRHHDIKTPCQSTGVCYDCKSPQRICNTWSIAEKSYPKGRIKVVIIDAELGL